MFYEGYGEYICELIITTKKRNHMYYVYRMENEKGQGPYRMNGPKLSEMIIKHSDSPNHPTPFEDGEPFENEICKDISDYLFGFLYIEDLKEWFNGYLEELQEYGFHIAVYKVYGEIRCGKKQVAFLKNEAYKQ